MTLIFPLCIKQGTTWGMAFPVLDPTTGNPITVDGWSARGQVRSSTLLTDTVILQEWSAAHSNITVAGTFVTISVAPAVSLAWTWTRGVYDLHLTDPDGNDTCLSEGLVTVDPAVTR